RRPDAPSSRWMRARSSSITGRVTDVLMALAMGLENSTFHICSHYANRVNRSLKEGEGWEGWASELFCHFSSKYHTCGHARAVAHFKRIVRLREDQAMRQVTPT